MYFSLIEIKPYNGDVASLTDEQGNTVATYIYDEFGNLISSAGTIYNPLRYSGANNAYFDEETGLYKMGTRYYQPDIGRWLTRDSYRGDELNPQSQNRYVYVENNPVNNTDSTGLWKDVDHESLTKRIASKFWSKSEAELLGKFNRDFDWEYNAVEWPEYHFGRLNALQAPTNAYRSVKPWMYERYNRDYRVLNAKFTIDRAREAKNRDTDNKRKLFLYQIAAGSHMIQDIYAHMNATPWQHMWGIHKDHYDKISWNPGWRKLGKRWRWKRTKRATKNFLKFVISKVGK